jgi:aspartokinase
MARAVGVQCTGPSLSSVTLSTGEERSAGCAAGALNSQDSLTQHNTNSSAGLQDNMEHLADRLHTLHQLYENRNQVHYNS